MSFNNGWNPIMEDAKDALRQICDAVASDQVEMTAHFDSDSVNAIAVGPLLTFFDQPTRMEDQGPEVRGWPKWRVWGKAADGTPAGVVVAIREDGRVRFITIHWEE
jgi:hypothetical protein